MRVNFNNTWLLSYFLTFLARIVDLNPWEVLREIRFIFLWFDLPYHRCVFFIYSGAYLPNCNLHNFQPNWSLLVWSQCYWWWWLMFLNFSGWHPFSILFKYRSNYLKLLFKSYTQQISSLISHITYQMSLSLLSSFQQSLLIIIYYIIKCL